MSFNFISDVLVAKRSSDIKTGQTIVCSQLFRVFIPLGINEHLASIIADNLEHPITLLVVRFAFNGYEPVLLLAG